MCTRETTPDPSPQTPEERVYAATLALNAGAPEEALEHLEVAVANEPDSDHIHYMLAVARAAAGETEAAVTHLQRAIELNPDNQLQAEQEPDFDGIRKSKPFLEAIAAS